MSNQSQKKQTTIFILCAITLHVFLVASIFDVYFTSAVTIGLNPINVTYKPTAKRLVLFVSDGLRSNKLFHNQMENTPFLKKIVQEQGTWGISHTRVPTESRPGHVALIAGFYEDVASITKGWQENAVEFDSLFNRSANTWSWGSPDILPMFVKGASQNKIFYQVYPPHMEDFASKNISQLDTWVFEKVKDFLESARQDDSLKQLLLQDGVVFFLHLLGIDTNGHSNKPHSEIYSENIKIVDRGVSQISQLIDQFYNDKRTAFLFTADHGMTNWGSHGAGSLDETMTPLIAWGSSVAGPIVNLSVRHSDLHGLMLDLPQRRDVEQADICPLMAALIGVPIPTNSVGRIPLPYLSLSLSDKVEIAKSNCLQILQQFKAKRAEKKRSSYPAMFTEFRKLSPSKASDNLRQAADLAHRNEFVESIRLYEETRDLALEGIEYYHKYDRLSLGGCMAITFILWILLILSELLPSKSKFEAHIERSWTDNLQSQNSSFLPQLSLRNVILVLVLVLLVIFMKMEERPWSHWLYHSLPVFLVWHASARIIQIKRLISIFTRHYKEIVIALILVEILVWSFFYRFLLSIGMVIIGLSPFVDKTIGGPRNKTRLKLFWFLICSCLCLFPLLPVIGGYVNMKLVFLAGLCSSSVAIYVFFNMPGLQPAYSGYREFLSSRCLLICPLLAAVIVIASHKSIAAEGGVPILYQIVSWTGLVSLVPIGCCLPARIGSRLFGLSLSLLTIFIFLSIAYEAFFVFFLILLVWTWNLLENQPDTPQWFSVWTEKYFLTYTIHSGQISDRIYQPMSGRDVRRGILFIFLLFFAYFGTGNIASINSFDPNSVYCFVTIFQPFVMGSLMMVKIMIPLLIVSCTYVTLQWETLRLLDQCYLTMAVADLIALHFFWMIQDSGSWLHIGISISHYLISMGTSTAALLFLTLAKYLLQLTTFCRHFSPSQIKEHIY